MQLRVFSFAITPILTQPHNYPRTFQSADSSRLLTPLHRARWHSRFSQRNAAYLDSVTPLFQRYGNLTRTQAHSYAIHAPYGGGVFHAHTLPVRQWDGVRARVMAYGIIRKTRRRGRTRHFDAQGVFAYCLTCGRGVRDCTGVIRDSCNGARVVYGYGVSVDMTE